jgi:hypothetical protein
LAWHEPAEEESVLSLVVGETKTANLVCVSNYAIRIDVSLNEPLKSIKEH